MIATNGSTGSGARYSRPVGKVFTLVSAKSNARERFQDLADRLAHRPVDLVGGQERVQHGDVRRDAEGRHRIEREPVRPHERLRGRDRHEQRGLGNSDHSLRTFQISSAGQRRAQSWST